MKSTPETITLACTDGPHEVRAWRIGQVWAVHHSIGFMPGTFNEFWTLTHAPSSLALYKCFKTRKAATALAQDLIARTPPAFWSFKTKRGWERKLRAMRRAFLTTKRLRERAIE